MDLISGGTDVRKLEFSVTSIEPKIRKLRKLYKKIQNGLRCRNLRLRFTDFYLIASYN